MQTSTISFIKKELQQLPQDKLVELCISLAKYKKENKEVLDYWLFKAHDEQEFLDSLKQEMDIMFQEINQSNVFFVKKSLRKILRFVAKYAKYSKLPVVQIELLICFCQLVKKYKIRYRQTPVLAVLYQNQVNKIEKEIAKLHEDLQFDYQQQLEEL